MAGHLSSAQLRLTSNNSVLNPGNAGGSRLRPKGHPQPYTNTRCLQLCRPGCHQHLRGGRRRHGCGHATRHAHPLRPRRRRGLDVETDKTWSRFLLQMDRKTMDRQRMTDRVNLLWSQDSPIDPAMSSVPHPPEVAGLDDVCVKTYNQSKLYTHTHAVHCGILSEPIDWIESVRPTHRYP